MRRTPTESRFLDELVSDCITYGLKEKEALKYVEVKFGQEIKSRSYEMRKSKLLSEGSMQIWLNHFTRIGFVQHHKEQIEHIQKLQDDSLKQFYLETINEQRNEDKILKLKQDIRDNVKLLSELGLGTPIISAIKAKIEDAKTVQVSQ